MNKFDPDDFPDRICCGALEYMQSLGWDLPFTRPIVVDDNNHSLKSIGWSVRFMRFTDSYKISQTRGPHLMMNYCPFCGKEFQKKEGTNE